MNNNLRAISKVLTKADLFNIETEAFQKASFLANTQKQFELLYSKYYLDLIQEKVLEKIK